MATLNRTSVLFLTEETSSGVPVDPSAGTEAVALQDGFTLTPAFDILENAELKSSIGQAKQILGLEQPSVSFDHYLRHSGTEADDPNYDLLIRSAMGAKRTRATERDVVSATAGTASAAATITVDAGEGVEFARGDMLLIKDGTNGYNVRPVDSVAGDVLTLGFNLSNAPAAAVNLGRDVTYGPGTAAPTFSSWLYRGNGGAIELVAGNRVETMDIAIEAGQFINASYTTQGTSYRFNPITITAGSNDALDFDDAGGEENATIAAATYKYPQELASAIQTAMDALTADNITVSYSNDDGKFTIASDGGTLSLLWNTGTNTATTIGGTIGFAVAADDTGATSYEGDSAITLSAPFTPSFDSADPLVAKDNELYLGGFDDIACVSARSVSVSLSNTINDVQDICAESGVAEKVATARAVSIDITANLDVYEADKFKRFNEGEDTKFMYVFGTKSGGNWEAGKSGAIYSPTCTITAFELASQDDTVVLNMTVAPFVNDDGDGEFYIGFV